jgi:glutathione S-transferase
MEVLHTIEVAKAPITLENVDWEDEEKRKVIKPQSPTGTLPCLCIENGKISQSKAIEYYVAEKYKPELLGATPEEKAEVIQWMNFAMCEIYRCTVDLIYPIFGWKQACKEEVDAANKSIKDYIKIVESHLNGKKYFVGGKMTLADIIMFFHLRYYFQFVWVEGMRKNMLKNTTTWFSEIMETAEAKKAYGRTILCKSPLKAPVAPKKEEEKKVEKKEAKKKKKLLKYQNKKKK